jgi:hypothetical protein
VLLLQAARRAAGIPEIMGTSREDAVELSEFAHADVHDNGVTAYYYATVLQLVIYFCCCCRCRAAPMPASPQEFLQMVNGFKLACAQHQ